MKKRVLISTLLLGMGAVYAESLTAQTSVVVNQMGVGVKASMPAKGSVVLADGTLKGVTLVTDTIGLKADSTDAVDVAKSPLWLDVKKYPTATFKSVSVVPGKKTNEYVVQGQLTIKNITKPIVVNATLIPKGKTMGDVQTILTFNRLDYGLGLDLWKDISVVKNNVNLEIRGHYE